MNAKQYLDSKLLEPGHRVPFYTADDYWLLYRLCGQMELSKWFKEIMKTSSWSDGDGYRFHPLGRAAAPYSRGLYVPR